MKGILSYLRLIVIIIVPCLLLISPEQSNRPNPQRSPHNCRFWGMVFTGELDSLWQNTVRIHLDSLQGLGILNNDGWGLGYYLAPDSSHLIPFMRRGAPRAPDDPRYDRAVDEMISYAKKACVAHIRNASSGPHFGIPDPHPFRRTSTNTTRDLDMLFAHNGTIETQYLLDLLRADYLMKNPPDFSPNYLDSDLYAIYLLQTIDTYSGYAVDSCLKIAVKDLVTHLHFNNEYAQLNFVLTDGTTLWALRYADVSTHYYTLYYYNADQSVTDQWIAASQPLDTTGGWRELPNYTLTTLKPNEPPITYSFEIPEGDDGLPSSFYFEKLSPNVCSEMVVIRFYSPDARHVTITLYNESGQSVAKLFSNEAAIGMNEVLYRPRTLPSGIYFIHLKTKTEHLTEKVIIQR